MDSIIRKKIVFIEWLDSRGITHEWEYVDQVSPLKPCKCKSVGILLKNYTKYITIAQSISKDQVIGRITIPKMSILKIKRLNL